MTLCCLRFPDIILSAKDVSGLSGFVPDRPLFCGQRTRGFAPRPLSLRLRYSVYFASSSPSAWEKATGSSNCNPSSSWAWA